MATRVIKSDKDVVKEAIKKYVNLETSRRKCINNLSKSAHYQNKIDKNYDVFDIRCINSQRLLYEILYQNRLHTFANKKVSYDTFESMCDIIFKVIYLKNKRINYEITLFKSNELYKTVKYIVMYRKLYLNKDGIECTEYRFFSLRNIYDDTNWEKYFQDSN